MFLDGLVSFFNFKVDLITGCGLTVRHRMNSHDSFNGDFHEASSLVFLQNQENYCKIVLCCTHDSINLYFLIS